MLGSCFCFTHVRQHEGLHTKLFPTIARNLADRDLHLRPLLAQAISNDYSLKDTADIAMQWQEFIIEPLSRLEGSSTANVVVVINALDESDGETTRELVLEAFAVHGAKLVSYPTGLTDSSQKGRTVSTVWEQTSGFIGPLHLVT